MDGTTGVNQSIAGGRVSPTGANPTTSRPQVPANVMGQVGTLATNPIGGAPVDSSSRSAEVTGGLNAASVTSASNGESAD